MVGNSQGGKKNHWCAEEIRVRTPRILMCYLRQWGFRVYLCAMYID